MDTGLREAVVFYGKYMTEAGKLVIGLDDAKQKTLISLFSEIPTTFSAKKHRRVNSGAVWYMGVPGVGKTFCAIVIAGVTNTIFGRIQGRSDLTPSEVVGVEIFNPKTGEFEIRKGTIAKVNILLIDEGTRIPPKSQSAFLEANQDRTITIGDTQIELQDFYFPIMTANPIEVGEGTYPMSAANADRFTFVVDIGYLPPDEEQKLVNFNIKAAEIEQLLTAELAIEMRSLIAEKVKIPYAVEKYIRRLVVATRPRVTDKKETSRLLNELGMENNEANVKFVQGRLSGADSPSELVQEYVALGASPRATMSLGPTSKARALFVRGSDTVFPEDVKALAKNIFGHRIFLKSNARRMGITVNDIIEDVLEKVPVP